MSTSPATQHAPASMHLLMVFLCPEIPPANMFLSISSLITGVVGFHSLLCKFLLPGITLARGWLIMLSCTNLVFFFLSPYLSVGASVMTYGEALPIEQPDLSNPLPNRSWVQGWLTENEDNESGGELEVTRISHFLHLLFSRRHCISGCSDGVLWVTELSQGVEGWETWNPINFFPSRYRMCYS